MSKKYFEVELEYTGTKMFKIELDKNFSRQEALAYIAENYHRLDKDHNAISDDVNPSVLAIHFRED